MWDILLGTHPEIVRPAGKEASTIRVSEPLRVTESLPALTQKQLGGIEPKRSQTVVRSYRQSANALHDIDKHLISSIVCFISFLASLTPLLAVKERLRSLLG